MIEIIDTLRRIERKQDAVLAALRVIAKGEAFIMSTIDDLKAEVTQTIGEEESAIALINGLADKLQAAIDGNANSATQVAAITDVIGQLRAERASLAAAVVARTPAPTPPATPSTGAATPPSTGAEPAAGGTPAADPAPGQPGSGTTPAP